MTEDMDVGVETNGQRFLGVKSVLALKELLDSGLVEQVSENKFRVTPKGFAMADSLRKDNERLT